MTLVNTALKHVIQPSKPTAPSTGAVSEYFRDSGDGYVKKYAQSSSGEEVRISGAEINYLLSAPVVSSTDEEGDTSIVTSDGTKNGTVKQVYTFSTVGGAIWKKTFDSADNVWSKNTTNTSIDLNQKSSGVARTAGTEIVVKDTGNVGIGTTNPLTPIHIKGASSGAIATLESPTASSSVFMKFKNNSVDSGYVGFGSTNNEMHLINYTANKLHLGTNSSVKLTVDSVGKVGIGTTAPETALDISSNGVLKFDNGAVNNYLNLGSYSSASSAVTGAIKIKFPLRGTNSMFNVKIKVYDYSINGASEIICGGYNYSGGMTNNATVFISGDFPSNLVRYGRNATESYILLGAVNTVWSYPKVIVEEAMIGHSVVDGYGSPWVISLVTTTGTDTLNTPRSNKATPWIAPTFQNSWVNYGGGYASAQYRKIDDRVELRGLIKSGVISIALPAFTLPVGYRPINRIIFPIISNGLMGRLDITNTGLVIPYSGSNVWFSLNGISFSTI